MTLVTRDRAVLVSGFRAPAPDLAFAASHELAWQDQALCMQTDPEEFFPERGGATRAAKQVCRSCEVRAQCLEYALENDERFGVWGGLSERQRRRVAADRKAAA